VRKLTFIIVISAVLSALSGAQFMMGGGQGSQYMLLMRPDVKKDLKITDDEQTKLDAAQQDMMGQMRQVFQDAQGDREAMQTGMKKLMDGLATSIKGILTADQIKRLGEINVQMQGAMILTDPDQQKALKLTDDQVKQVKDLQTKQQAANQSLFEKVQSGDIDRSEIQGLMQKNNDALKAALEKVLTDDQKAQLKKMGGAPFDKDPNYKPQGFGRPPGGGGGN
jgi:hypothetical protein